MKGPSSHLNLNALPFLQIYLIFVSQLYTIGPSTLLLANAETPLANKTEKNDVTPNATDIGKMVSVRGYNVNDQCILKPGRTRIRPHAIVLQMANDGFNGGTGITFCYPGQLDKLNHFGGMTAGAATRISNIKGNTVAERCEQMRNETCKGGSNPACKMPWHGFQLVHTENGRDLQMALSTTNNRFIIKRDWFKNGRLFLILTQWKSTISRLSNDMDIDNGMINDDSEWPEYNHFDFDHMVSNVYSGNVTKGALIKPYMGPWALGVDILPMETDHSGIIHFFVLKSQCSELQAAYLLPIDDQIKTLNEPKLMNITTEPLDGLQQGLLCQIHGKLHKNAKNFTLQWNCLDCWGNNKDEDRIKGFRVIVNVGGAIQFKTCKSKCSNINMSIDDNNTLWTPVDEDENSLQNKLDFKDGQHFILMIQFFEEYLSVRLNCAEEVRLEFGNKLMLASQYNLTTDGDVDIFNRSRSTCARGAIRPPLKVNEGEGALIRLNISEKWKKITLTFSTGDYRLLTLQLSSHLESATVEWLKKMPSLEMELAMNTNNNPPEMHNKVASIKNVLNGTMVEIHLQIEKHEVNDGNGMILLLNGINLFVFLEIYRPKITNVRVEGDIVKITKLVTTQKVPYIALKSEEELKYFKSDPTSNSTILIAGKVLENGSYMRIKFYFHNEFGQNNTRYDFGYCEQHEKENQCSIPLGIQIYFKDKTMLLSSMTNKKVWNPKPLKYNFTAFGPNDDFEIRIQARDNKGYAVNLKKPDVSCQPESPISTECANGFYKKEQILLSYIVITGDIWLFGKPRVVQHKDLHPEMKMMGKHLKSMKHGESHVNVRTPWQWHNIIHRHQFQQVPKDANAKNENEQ